MNGDYSYQNISFSPQFISSPAEGPPRQPATSRGSWGTAPKARTGRTFGTPETARPVPEQLAAVRHHNDTGNGL